MKKKIKICLFKMYLHFTQHIIRITKCDVCIKCEFTLNLNLFLSLKKGRDSDFSIKDTFVGI